MGHIVLLVVVDQGIDSIPEVVHVLHFYSFMLVGNPHELVQFSLVLLITEHRIVHAVLERVDDLLLLRDVIELADADDLEVLLDVVLLGDLHLLRLALV